MIKCTKNLLFNKISKISTLSLSLSQRNRLTQIQLKKALELFFHVSSQNQLKILLYRLCSEKMYEKEEVVYSSLFTTLTKKTKTKITKQKQ